MKHFLMTTLLLASTNVFAAKLVNIESFTNKSLEKLRVEIVSLDSVTHTETKKVLSFTAGKSAEEQREKAIAQALHTACGFFDDGVEATRDSKDDKGAVTATETFLDETGVFKGDKEYNSLLKSLKAANKQVGVEIYSGNASGNNTVGTVLGIFDSNTNELAVFAHTNCGSDD